MAPTIELLMLAGALVGLLASLLPTAKMGCWALAVVPLTALVATYVLNSRPHQELDGQAALAYIFVPLWPSAGALVGLALGWAVRKSLGRRRMRDDSQTD